MDRMKRARASKDRLPLRYRCKDKYNRALATEMHKFFASDSVQNEDTSVENTHPIDSSSRDANTIGIKKKWLILPHGVCSDPA